MSRLRHGGSAAVDYVGAVIVVGLLLAALVALRPQEASRRPPVNPAAPLARLVVQPAVRRPRPPGRPRSSPRRTPRPPPPAPVIVDAPGWLGR